MQKKLFGVFFLILLLGILLTGFLYTGLIQSSYLGEVEKRLVSNARLIEQSMLERIPLETEAMNAIVEDFSRRIDVRISFFDGEGAVVAETCHSPAPLENHRDRPEVAAALAGEIGRDTRMSTVVDEELFYVAVPVTAPNLPFQVIRLAVSLNEVQQLNLRLYSYTGISILIGLVVSLLLAYRFIGQIMIPIQEIIGVSKKIALGRLESRVAVVVEDEIGELAKSFNDMADRLEEMVGQLSESNTKFKGLLTSIRNPIIAVDTKRRIMLLNPAAETLFGIRLEDSRGKHLLEVVRNNVLDEHIKEILIHHLETQTEIQLHDPVEKILKIYSNPITLESDPTRVMGIVALIEDVTEIRHLEKMRSDFVANVSHELKTPLTSISGFVETLKSGGIEDEELKMRFLDIIELETERLTRLIDDILTLSEIENIHLPVVKEDIDVNSVIEEVYTILRPLAENKELQLVVETGATLPPIVGTRDRFKQMLINLVDNSIKYTPAGGKVIINSYQKYNNVIISVKDTGIGIPKKDIPRLFERFYRVDKARSRKVGGTGLGLAIVKHIVLSLEGRIKVYSEVGKGTEFIVILPAKTE